MIEVLTTHPARRLHAFLAPEDHNAAERQPGSIEAFTWSKR